MEKKIYKVSELNSLIKQALEKSYKSVWLEGELSNVSFPASGHCYLTLKDESSQIDGVVWRSALSNLKFEPKSGAKVRVYGDIGVYVPRGRYQLVIRQMEDAGKGALQEQFEKLKEKLSKEGFFAEERKKKLPMLPQHVGVVTSRTGAALQDILNVINRRFPNLHIVLAPVKVQGEGAAQEIADGIDMLNELGGLDVMIVGRGGGSLEDLWCFNEEVVARAIARSEVPVISAVGHEIDFTISDFTADLRAPTPSAAAELVVGRKDAFEEDLKEYNVSLIRLLRETVLEMRNRLLAVSGSYIFTEPKNMVRNYQQRLDSAAMRMQHVAKMALSSHASDRQRLNNAFIKMQHSVESALEQQAYQLKRMIEQLNMLNPKAVLSRGYSITLDGDGKALRDAGEAAAGDKIKTILEKGSLDSEVR
ncbi:exodeoxyribonuclease VII large subunit [bacterium E08(2017)]|nr:exodeoxyribonuclease VII large subunit [bacterium E08(2017)]